MSWQEPSEGPFEVETVTREGIAWEIKHGGDREPERSAEYVDDEGAAREFVDEYIQDEALAAELLAALESGDLTAWEGLFDYGDLV